MTSSAYLSAQTLMVGPSCRTLVFELTIRVEGLGENHDALSRDLVLFEEFAENHLGFSGRVRVGSVKGLLLRESFPHVLVVETARK